MELSKRAFGQIIQASARSDSPIEDEVLVEIAQEHGDDPEAVLNLHREWRQDWKDRKDADQEPLPFIVT